MKSTPSQGAAYRAASISFCPSAVIRPAVPELRRDGVALNKPISLVGPLMTMSSVRQAD